MRGTVEPIIAVTGVEAKNTADAFYGKIPVIKIPEEGQKLIALVKEQLEKSGKKPVN